MGWEGRHVSNEVRDELQKGAVGVEVGLSAILGNRSRTPVPYIAESWGGLDKHKPLIDNILNWPMATSPKLPPEDPDPGGCRSSQQPICRAA
jgi:hypothetical protein